MKRFRIVPSCFVFLIAICLGGCFYDNSNQKPPDLERVVVYNIQDSLCVIHPFSTDSGYVVVIPNWWNEEDVRIDKDPSLKDSELFIYKTHLNTLFVNTESGTMDYIHADKENREQIEATVITKDGSVEYSGLGEMHGRGNLTWGAEKKPYNIKLQEKSSIFNLSKSKKFCLLANAFDPTSLHNWIAFKVAEAVGLPFSVKFDYATLYLNGNYMGIYLITNKVAVEGGSVDICPLQKETSDLNERKLKTYRHYELKEGEDDVVEKGYEIKNDPEDISGGYLLELCYKTYDKSKSGFIPTKEIPCALKYPEYASSKQVKWIKNYFEDMLCAMAAPDGMNSSTGKHFSEYIDVSSFVLYYMLQEALMNPDGGRGSFFLYKDRGEKMCAGPIWDFDLALPTGVDPKMRNAVNALVVANRKHMDGSPFILGNLVKHQEIQNLICEKWNQFVKDSITSYTIGDRLMNHYNGISHDLALNKMRWNLKVDMDSDVANMRKEAHDRINFLDSLWGRRLFNEKNIVRLNIGMGAANGERHRWEHEFYIKGDMPLPDLPSVWEGKKNCGWYDYKTNKKYGRDRVTSPAHLYLKWEEMSFVEKLWRRIL